MEITIREIAITRLKIIEKELIETARKLMQKAVFFKQDTLAMRNIEKALAEIAKAQKKLKEK